MTQKDKLKEAIKWQEDQIYAWDVRIKEEAPRQDVNEAVRHINKLKVLLAWSYFSINSNLMAPSSNVCLISRSSTFFSVSGCGCSNWLSKPAEITTVSGFTAARNGSDVEVLLP